MAARGVEPGPEAAAERRGALVRTGLRMAGALALVARFLRSGALLATTSEALRETAWDGFAAAMLAYGTGLLLSACRLQVLLRAGGNEVGLAGLLADVVKATGLNALLTVGSGEVYRVARLRARGIGTLEAGTFVLLDRLIGLGVLVAAGVAGLLAFGGGLTGVRLPLPVLLLLAAAAAVGGHRAGRTIVARLAPGALPFFSQPRVMAGALACSAGVLLAWIVSVWLLCRALGLGVAPTVVAFAAPLVATATLLPVSVGGIGLREAGYALLLGPYGVTAGGAVALGLLQYCGYLGVAAIGGGLLLLERRPRPGASRAGVAPDELGTDA